MYKQNSFFPKKIFYIFDLICYFDPLLKVEGILDEVPCWLLCASTIRCPLESTFLRWLCISFFLLVILVMKMGHNILL